MLTCSSTCEGNMGKCAQVEEEECVMKGRKKDICECFYRLLHLDLVDLDAEQLVFKIIVGIKAVSVLHVFPSGVLVKDSCFPAGQGLQRTLELSLLCARQDKCQTV